MEKQKENEKLLPEQQIEQLQKELAEVKEKAERYEKWYFEKVDEVKSLKQFITNLGNQIEIFNKTSKI